MSITEAVLVIVGSLINLTHPGYYLHWGVIQISAANATVIGLMIVLFLAAVLLPFPRDEER
jgi:hypothetical protein